MFNALDIHKSHLFMKWLTGASFGSQTLSEIAAGSDNLRWLQDLFMRVSQAASAPLEPPKPIPMRQDPEPAADVE